MKTIFCTMLLLCAVAAFGQASIPSAVNVQPLYIQDSPRHADMTALADEHFLVGGMPGGTSSAHGERPLWEFGPVSEPSAPLGDVAREYRKQKMDAPRARIVFEKQGS
jgi:hypothetical protein